jgi:hypothetical protein
MTYLREFHKISVPRILSHCPFSFARKKIMFYIVNDVPGGTGSSLGPGHMQTTKQAFLNLLS